MNAHLTAQRASQRTNCLVRSFPRRDVQAFPDVQLRDPRECLRARKRAAREAFGYRSGGEPLKVIADAFGVSKTRAGELLNDAYPDDITETYLVRLPAKFAHVAEAVRAVKLGVAGSARRAA